MRFSALAPWEQWVVVLLIVATMSVALLAWLFVLVSWYGTFTAWRERRRGKWQLTPASAAIVGAGYGPVLHSNVPHVGAEIDAVLWNGSDEESADEAVRRAQQYEASYRLVAISVDGGQLVVRDRNREHRFPLVDDDPVRGVQRLQIVEEVIHRAHRTYVHDLLVGLNTSHERIFQCYLGWPPEAVREFCQQAGLSYGRITLDHPGLGEVYPPTDDFVRLRDSNALGLPARIGLFGAVALPAYPVLLVSRWAALGLCWAVHTGVERIWGSG